MTQGFESESCQGARPNPKKFSYVKKICGLCSEFQSGCENSNASLSTDSIEKISELERVIKHVVLLM